MADPTDIPPTKQVPPTDQAPASPTPLFICPYCGGPTPDQPRCAQCSGLLDPLSRQATQNAMGPWFIRDDQQPHRPGCSYETIVALITRGRVTLDSVLRGPTTAQFWYPAKRIPGIANKLGVCHACQSKINTEPTCPTCHTNFEVEGDRQTLGLMPVRMIPTPGTPESQAPPPGAANTVTEPRSATPAIPTRVMSSISVPSVAETRLRGDLAAARRRGTLLLLALITAVIVGVVAVGVAAFSWASPSREVQQPPRATSIPQANANQSAASPADPAKSSAPQSTVPSAPVTQPEVMEPKPPASSEASPAQSPAPPSEPQPKTPPPSADLQTLRRTKLP